jgi:hypothetical protein
VRGPQVISQTELMGSFSMYLISTAIANKAKAKFYDEDLPGLEDVTLFPSFLYGKL